MNIKFGSNTCKTIVFKNQDVKYVKFIQGFPQANVNYIIWAKPYTLTINKGTGVASVTVTRTSTKVKDVPTNVSVSSGGTIYHGDELSVKATASSGYKVNNPYLFSGITVDGNKTVEITATKLFAEPTIIYDGYKYQFKKHRYNFTFKNTNDVSVTWSATLNDSTTLRPGFGETNSISANSSASVSYVSTKRLLAAKVSVTFTASDGRTSTKTVTFSV